MAWVNSWYIQAIFNFDGNYHPSQNPDSHDWKQYLLDGEEISWTGRPKNGFRISRYDLRGTIKVLFFPLVGPFMFFGSFYRIFFLDGGGPEVAFFIPMGLIFSMIGFYGIFWRNSNFSKRRHNIFYALTNKRAFIFENDKIQAIDLNNQSVVKLQKNLNSYNIVFDQVVNDRYNPHHFSPYRNLTFERIENGEALYEQILQIARKN